MRASTRKWINRCAGIFFAGLFVIYVGSFWYSLRKVDRFCASTAQLKGAAEIPHLAVTLDVNYTEIKDDGGDGRTGIVASPFTVGDYACIVKIEDNKIVSATITPD